MEFLAASRTLKSADIAFFIICGATVLIIVGIYFLIPLLNKKQYAEQRDNLRNREKIFNESKDNEKLESLGKDLEKAEKIKE